ncbi:MAG: hypothetical protein ACXVCO_01235 [Ktedonobacterales bacterium]
MSRVSNRKRKYRDVLRERVVTKVLGDPPPSRWSDEYVQQERLHSAIRISVVNGHPTNNQKVVHMTLVVKGETVFFREPVATFPSEKLLAQLALVL